MNRQDVSTSPALKETTRARGRSETWGRWAPLILVALPVLFNLWALRAQLLPAQNLNDSSVHFQMVRWALGQIGEGKTPLDGWYPYLSQGSSLFSHYQVLGHLITAYAATILGADTASRLALYLLLALWPVCIYWSGRLFGLDRWTSAASAVVSPLLVSVTGLGYEWGAYTWEGFGVWSQLWGMWTLPLAWALSWRAVSGRGGYVPAALALAASIAFHFLTGYLGLISIGIFVLIEPSEFRKRIWRGLVVGVGSVLIAAWVVVPVLADSKWILRSRYTLHSVYADSYGPGRVLSWMVRGRIFDSNRFPIVSLLVAVGIAVCVARFQRRELCRVFLGVWALSLLLFFGKRALGPLVHLLPVGSDLLLQRFIIGVHLGGILLAGVGITWLGRQLLRWAPRSLRLPPTAGAVSGALIGVLVLTPAWLERLSSQGGAAGLIRIQQAADLAVGPQLDTLVAKAASLGPGRLYAGLRSNWGEQNVIGEVPVLELLAARDVDSVGFTLRVTSLMGDIETYFDESNPAQYNLFNIRYLILPNSRSPSVNATKIEIAGQNTLWEVATTGYLQVLDTTSPIAANNANNAQQMLPFLESANLANNLFPTVAWAGGPAADPTDASGAVLSGPAGVVTQEFDLGADGAYGGTVTANRDSVVMLKVSYGPRWSVVVDGVAQPLEMIAPAYMGVRVPAGVHTLAFRYRTFPDYPVLFVIGVLAILALWVLPWLQARRRPNIR